MRNLILLEERASHSGVGQPAHQCSSADVDADMDYVVSTDGTLYGYSHQAQAVYKPPNAHIRM